MREVPINQQAEAAAAAAEQQQEGTTGRPEPSAVAAPPRRGRDDLIQGPMLEAQATGMEGIHLMIVSAPRPFPLPLPFPSRASCFHVHIGEKREASSLLLASAL
ncbi:hypothetical protein S7711_11143 [Stachybotrys chartarum IBT 7711]|uniref:Uncharacterized protein n=1 Tax=Stachybotrys chartarum (strain CBS 109288 / IBT 7711) TaxID=1280523 RepID=A0A084AI88_STACB|nr:hypothetical protein S7711_11143 [Stachybotrys chartarum IBT 7711]